MTPEMPFTGEHVEAGCRALHANLYDGPEDLDEDARVEIVRLVLSAVVPEIREAAYAAGYAEAVARLRNDDRYRDWWTATPERSFGTAYWAPDGRRHLADYLETVGVDQ